MADTVSQAGQEEELDWHSRQPFSTSEEALAAYQQAVSMLRAACAWGLRGELPKPYGLTASRDDKAAIIAYTTELSAYRDHCMREWHRHNPTMFERFATTVADTAFKLFESLSSSSLRSGSDGGQASSTSVCDNWQPCNVGYGDETFMPLLAEGGSSRSQKVLGNISNVTTRHAAAGQVPISDAKMVAPEQKKFV